MEKFKGKLPKRNGKYLIEIHSEKFIAYYNKLIKKFIHLFLFISNSFIH